MSCSPVVHTRTVSPEILEMNWILVTEYSVTGKYQMTRVSSYWLPESQFRLTRVSSYWLPESQFRLTLHEGEIQRPKPVLRIVPFIMSEWEYDYKLGWNIPSYFLDTKGLKWKAKTLWWMDVVWDFTYGISWINSWYYCVSWLLEIVD